MTDEYKYLKAELKALNDHDFMDTLANSLVARMVAAGDEELYARMKRIDNPHVAELEDWGD
jgi:hypothetical protein